jgi:hypothetical protein
MESKVRINLFCLTIAYLNNVHAALFHYLRSDKDDRIKKGDLINLFEGKDNKGIYIT